MKIEKNITQTDRRTGEGRKKYPFAEMEIGDSFEVLGNYILVKNRVQAAASNYVKYYNLDKVFSTQKTEAGVRIFRVK